MTNKEMRTHAQLICEVLEALKDNCAIEIMDGRLRPSMDMRVRGAYYASVRILSEFSQEADPNETEHDFTQYAGPIGVDVPHGKAVDWTFPDSGQLDANRIREQCSHGE